MLPHRQRLHFETAVREPAFKHLVRARGPNHDTPARLERLRDPLNAAQIINLGVARLHHRGRPVVDIESDRIVGLSRGTGDHRAHIFVQNFHA